MASRQRAAPKGAALRVAAVCALFHRTPQTLVRWRNDGYGPPWYVETTTRGAKTILYPEAETLAWGREHGYLRNGDTSH